MIELLSPVGDFECLKAAVQNGADAVYFGASSFSARSFATNFDDNTLELAINYAKLRGVRTNLTLNTLIKNHELSDAFELAKKAYKFGIDAIIVQDLGLAKLLIDNFPDLPLHASTQMSVHNLEGVKKLEALGFKRVVLSRELPLSEIEYICKNTSVEIECFVHGALCISYSGQCLFSSSIGGRSGNRGSCAQPCRLPYTLLENKDKEIDSGYLLSPRDLCGLEHLPQLIKAGITSFKIEGRMKKPEYVATVTRIYRKYIDLIQNGKDFEIDTQDKKDLLQVFNRGGSSLGHLASFENRNLIFKEKPNNMGLFLGTVSNFNNNKGYVTLKLNETLSIGDKVCIQTPSEEANYTISELMINKRNSPSANIGDIVTVGRIKGNVKVGNKIYKITDKKLFDEAGKTFAENSELKKVNLNCKVTLKKDIPMSIQITDNNGVCVNITSNICPVSALNAPITKERVISQISKTNNTPFNFTNIEIDMDDNIYISPISSLNELRRNALSEYENRLITSFKRTSFALLDLNDLKININTYKVSLLLNVLNTNFDYSYIKGVNRVYVPLKYWISNSYSKILENICNNFDTYIYLPCIMRNNYLNLFKNNIDKILNNFKIKGFVISNIGQFELVSNYLDNYDLIGNYTLNLFNSETAKNLNVSTICISPELDKDTISNLSVKKRKEVICYGNLPLMNSNYCPLGKSNKCYKDCDRKCMNNNSYFLKDRLGFLFKVVPDNIDTVSTIYNSKITSISLDGLNCDYARIDILDESIDEINLIVSKVLNKERLEGNEYTNGNLNKIV